MTENKDVRQRGRSRGRRPDAGRKRLTVALIILTVLLAAVAIGFFVKRGGGQPEETVATEANLYEIDNEAGVGAEGKHESGAGDAAEAWDKYEAEGDEAGAGDAAGAGDGNESFSISAQVEDGGAGSGSGDGTGDGSGGNAHGEAADGRPVELLFGGDIYLSEFVLNAYDKAGGIGGVLCEEYLREIEACDMFIANEEFPFSDRGEKAPDKQFTFRLPPERVNILSEMGVDLVTLANNHTLDFGEIALLDTVDTLDKAGILHMGAGKDKASAREPVIVELKGKRFGFIAASRVIPVSNWAAGKNKPGLFICYDPTELIEDVRKLEEQCDYTIVFLHWGTERKETPDAYMESMAKELVKSGADAVIGSHPHVLQPIELIDGKPVVYSLGNFVFGSKINRTMLVKLIFNEDGIGYELLPGKSAMGYTSMLGEVEKAEFIKHFPISESSIKQK